MSGLEHAREHDGGEPAVDQAIGWFTRLSSDAADEADWLGFERWLAAAPAHRLAYDDVERLWVELDGYADVLRRRLGSGAVVATLQRTRARAQQRRLFWTAALAASVIAAALVALQVRRPAPEAVYLTAKGELRSIALADGTRLSLGSASLVTVRLERDARRVMLAEGEVAFDVAKDRARPFLITAGDRQVRVVGTELDVLRHDGRVTVTVRRGVVEVRGEGEAVRLTPGLQLVHTEAGTNSQVRAVAADDAFAWRDRRLVCRDRTLAEVAAELNRYFPTPIRVDREAADLRFSGVLVLDEEDAVVGRLAGFLPIRADRSAGVIVLRSRP